jgi:hypothetical protein
VAADSVLERLGLHLGYGGADYAEDAIEIDAKGSSPLVSCHGGDRGVVGGPDAVVQYGAVEAAERGYGGGDEGLAIFWREEGLLDSAAEFRAAALLNKGLGLLGGGEVAEDYLCAGLTEEADGGCADSAGASGD